MFFLYIGIYRHGRITTVDFFFKACNSIIICKDVVIRTFFNAVSSDLGNDKIELKIYLGKHVIF